MYFSLSSRTDKMKRAAQVLKKEPVSSVNVIWYIQGFFFFGANILTPLRSLFLLSFPITSAGFLAYQPNQAKVFQLLLLVVTVAAQQ